MQVYTINNFFYIVWLFKTIKSFAIIYMYMHERIYIDQYLFYGLLYHTQLIYGIIIIIIITYFHHDYYNL